MMEKFEKRDSVVLIQDNQKMFGILHLPVGVKKPPIVLICHGLGGHKTGRYRVYVDLAEELLREQIAVFRFDFRGSGDSEGNFSEMTIGGLVDDTLNALGFLSALPDVDFGRLGIFGRSLGASIAVLSASKFGNVKSLALWAPMFDGLQWQQQWKRLKDGEMTEKESQEARRINGQVASIEFYDQMFAMPIDRALKDLKNTPILLIHGEQDNIIAVQHSESFLNARSSELDKTLFIRLPKGDHDFSYTEERVMAIKETCQWFKNTL